MVEREHALNLRRDHRSAADVDEAYYPQIESAIRAEAAEMAPHYEVFYSLETTIRVGSSASSFRRRTSKRLRLTVRDWFRLQE